MKYIQILLRVLMVCCVVAIAYLLTMRHSSNQEYAQGEAVYAEIRAVRQAQEAPESTDAPAKPTTGINFDALYEINSQTKAWLHAEDSIIDYPVVQGQDNDHYLTHLFTGEQNKLGTLFIDYRVPGDFTGKSTAIYGHNMKDGSMFATLIRYESQTYYESHPVLHLSTPAQNYELHAFAGIVGDGSYGFVRLSFTDDADFLAYTDAVMSASTFQSEITLQAEDQIVALVTCSYAFTNARYVLFAKLVPVA